MAKKKKTPDSPKLEGPSIEKLREMVAEYGQRGTSRLTGIPRTTIQEYLKKDRVTAKWNSTVETGYRENIVVKKLQETHKVPPLIGKEMVKGTQENLDKYLKSWDKITKNIEKTAWNQYQQRLELIKIKVLNGEKITKQEREMLTRGSGNKVRKEVKERAILNLQYTHKSFEVLWELYGRKAR